MKLKAESCYVLVISIDVSVLFDKLFFFFEKINKGRTCFYDSILQLITEIQRENPVA